MLKWVKRLFMRSRADARSMRVGQRRLRSGRGAAFIEFALLAPFLLMICSLMIETAVFWDASVMANHTAWTVGRIMKVKHEAKESQIFQIGELAQPTKDANGKTKEPNAYKKIAVSGLNKVIKGINMLGDQRNLTTVLMMSSCSIGYVGTPGNEIADFFKTVVTEPLNALAKEIPNSIEKMISGAVSPSEESGGRDFVAKIRQVIANWVVKTVVKPVVDAALKSLLSPVTDWIEGKLAGLGQKLNELLNQGDEFSPIKHYAHNFQKAMHRIVDVSKKKDVKLVLTQIENEGEIGTVDFLKPSGLQTYPQLNAGTPGYDKQLVLVRVQWPMESDWLFPLFWGGVRGKGTGVWASGHSLVLKETTLKNVDLESTGKSTYTAPGKNEPPLGKAGEQIRKDSRIELFLMRYRNTREELYVAGNFGETKYVQPWRDIAYSGGTNEAYEVSWSKCLDASWGLRYVLEVTAGGWLPGYEKREWLYYEEKSQQRFRYTGTLGRNPSTGMLKLTFNTKNVGCYSPTQMLAEIRRFGYGSSVRNDPDKSITNARSEAATALARYVALRKLVDKNIAELTKRIEGDGKSDVELDPETLQSMTGKDMTEGENELSEKKVLERWKKVLKDLKACRDRLNPIVKRVAKAYADLQTADGKLLLTLAGSYTSKRDDFFNADKEKKQKNKDKKRKKAAEELVKIYQNDIWPAVDQLFQHSETLKKEVDAAMKEEIKIGNLFNLDATSKLDPDNINWDQIANGLAEDDGVNPTKDPTDDGLQYGNDDGRGEGPWKR